MNSITISILVIDFILIFALPRRFVLIPILASGILLPMSERIVVLGLDFTVIRFLLLFGWIRLISRSEFHSIAKFNNIDIILCLYVLSIMVSYVLLWQTMDALVNRLGNAYYILGTYFLFRFYVIQKDDLERIIRCLVYLAIVIALFVVIERITQHNYFSIFGGVPNIMMRDGKLRCAGPFSHPITLGSFGAFLLPITFYQLWREKGSKKLGLVGLISSVVIVLASNSSGPLFALLGSALGLFMWKFRKFMRIIQWGVLLSIIGLHLVMKGPVWALIQRVPFITGSSSYHRFLLVDEFIARFNEWWLIGIQSTKHWSEVVALWDVSNGYLRIAADGGIVPLVLFIIIIALCFRHIGRMIFLASDNVEDQKLFWVLGSAMFAYVVGFIDVSLWDQTIMVWYFVVAIIASITYSSFGKLREEG